jgi:hypothetical protein
VSISRREASDLALRSTAQIIGLLREVLHLRAGLPLSTNNNGSPDL